MNQGNLEDMGPISIVAIDIGNSKTSIARWLDGRVEDVHRAPTAERDAILEALSTVRGLCDNQERQAIVIGSVVPDVAAWLAKHIEEDLDLRPFVVGANTPPPTEMQVREPDAVGVDRLCCTAAAYDRMERGCIVVDVGTAVTIDVIDDDGVFQGGAILPGLEMQAKALATQTAKLPQVKVELPPSPVGQDTTEAIQSGICYGMAGAIRGIVEQIATSQGKWPEVILTGGGAPLLLEHLDFADHCVPDLCLIGIGLAYQRRMERTVHGM